MVRVCIEKKNMQFVIEEFSKDADMARKWNLNFVSALMLLGGGQRPQVYCVLEAPGTLISPHYEKVPRTLERFLSEFPMKSALDHSNCPVFSFHARCFERLCSTVASFLPALYGRHSIDVSDPRRKCLILHTEKGEVLDSKHITNTIRAFLKRYDPELMNVTSMSLRASYATMMLMKHRRGDTFGDLPEEEFLAYLAKVMNTSREQLKGNIHRLQRRNVWKMCTPLDLYHGQAKRDRKTL